MSAFLNLKPDFSNLNDYIIKYDDILAGAEGKLNPEGKTLEEANRQLPIDFLFFAQCLQELKSMEKYADAILQQKKGEVWRQNKEDAQLDLNTRDLEHYTQASPAYMTQKKFVILIQEMVGQYDVVVKAFEHLAYKLKDLTAARIAEVHKYVI